MQTLTTSISHPGQVLTQPQTLAVDLFPTKKSKRTDDTSLEFDEEDLPQFPVIQSLSTTPFPLSTVPTFPLSNLPFPSSASSQTDRTAEKRLRTYETSLTQTSTTQITSLQRTIEAMQKFHEAQMSSLRAELQQVFAKKDEQISGLSKLCKHLADSKKQTDSELHSSLEENKILKKAVGIFDTRQKEISSQNQQMSQMLQSASHRIDDLERENRALKLQLQLTQISNSSSPFSPFGSPPPPDVY